MRLTNKIVLVSAIAMFLSGCNTWSDSNVQLKTGKADDQVAARTEAEPVKKKAKDVIVTTGDITEKKYRILGDLDVTVNKTTIFNADPTKEGVNEKLKEEAAALGADAVVLVRYGTVGVSLFSWGSLGGKGRAVVFTK